MRPFTDALLGIGQIDRWAVEEDYGSATATENKT